MLLLGLKTNELAVSRTPIFVCFLRGEAAYDIEVTEILQPVTSAVFLKSILSAVIRFDVTSSLAAGPHWPH